MTDVTTLLAGIKTREEAATKGPWASYGDLGHEVFRNTGIEDEEPTIAFDIEKAPDAAFIAAARTDVPRLVAALEAVAGLHKPYAICDECDCPEGTHPEDYEFIDCLDYSSCENSITGWACAECCSDAEGYNTEECADGHKHTMNKDKRCPTITAVVAALGGGE